MNYLQLHLKPANHHQYQHDKTSVRIILIGVSEEETISLGDWLKKKINTDTILITKSEIEYCFY